jgi:hypothetical protein
VKIKDKDRRSVARRLKSKELETSNTADSLGIARISFSCATTLLLS